jgi:hypothetical protein
VRVKPSVAMSRVWIPLACCVNPSQILDCDVSCAGSNLSELWCSLALLQVVLVSVFLSVK